MGFAAKVDVILRAGFFPFRSVNTPPDSLIIIDNAAMSKIFTSDSITASIFPVARR